MIKDKKPKCPECKSNRAVIKNGKPKVIIGRKAYTVQRYRCNECYRTFVYPSIKESLRNAT